MTDWKDIGRRVELRYRILCSHYRRLKYSLQMKRLDIELRLLQWYLGKLETINTLAESYRFQDGDDSTQYNE